MGPGDELKQKAHAAIVDVNGTVVGAHAGDAIGVLPTALICDLWEAMSKITKLQAYLCRIESDLCSQIKNTIQKEKGVVLENLRDTFRVHALVIDFEFDKDKVLAFWVEQINSSLHGMRARVVHYKRALCA
jgi:hypothetical protein